MGLNARRPYSSSQSSRDARAMQKAEIAGNRHVFGFLSEVRIKFDNGPAYKSCKDL